jgi:type II secretory pathway pseudopilin PulG
LNHHQSGLTLLEILVVATLAALAVSLLAPNLLRAGHGRAQQGYFLSELQQSWYRVLQLAASKQGVRLHLHERGARIAEGDWLWQASGDQEVSWSRLSGEPIRRLALDAAGRHADLIMTWSDGEQLIHLRCFGLSGSWAVAE